ncbi:MAG: transposase [Acidobacteria bacterium]|nr:transposase [Acidobacteriota bacterium]
MNFPQKSLPTRACRCKFNDNQILGVEKVTHWLRSGKGCPVNLKRVRRLMRLMCLMAVYQ